MKKISIIVAIYNIEDYIGNCLKSLKNQTYNENYEILLINDGSTDNSRKICEDFIKQGLKARIIDKENGGLSSVRNLGIKIAKGEYIFFIDGDDWIETDALEIINKELDSCDLLCFGFNWIGDNSITEDKRFLKNEKIYENFINYLFEDKINRSVWNKIFKKEILIKNNIEFPELKTIEDYTFCYKYLLNCNYLKKINIPLYNYRYRENSLSNDKREEYYLFHLKCFTYMIDLEKENKNTGFTKYLLEEYVYLIREYNKRKNKKQPKEIDSNYSAIT